MGLSNRNGLRMVWRQALLIGLSSVLACGEDQLHPPESVDLPSLYWELELNHRAVLLSMTAPYDTLTLIATPRNLYGEPLDDFPVAQYTSRDAARVRVDPSGLLRALTPSGSASTWVVVTLLAENIKYTDSVQVRVVADTTALTTFSIQPIPPDSAKIFAAEPNLVVPRTIPLQAVNANGVPVSGVPVYFRSSDPTIATVNRTTGGVKGLRSGTVNIFASTTVFGRTMTDILSYQVGRPAYAVIRAQQLQPSNGVPYTIFLPSEVTVGVGALVSWYNGTVGDTVDVNFAQDDLANIAAGTTAMSTVGSLILVSPVLDCAGAFGLARDCGAGNLFVTATLPPPGDMIYRIQAYRAFTVPGVYEFSSTRKGIVGRITVVADD